MRCINGVHSTVVVAMCCALLAACGGGGGYGGDDGGAPPPPPPPAPPTITVAPPSFAANRTVTLTADVTAAAGVTRVEFLVDGTVIGTATTAPYTIEWDTSAVADGAHALTARVTDASNNVVTSQEATVTVNNNPTISVALSPDETFPRPDSTASGSGEVAFNLLDGSVSGGVDLAGISATLAHIHLGYAGTAGPVIVDFAASSGDPNRWEPVAGSMLTAQQIDDLFAGKLYVNVHSAAFPQGEIRGQIQPENIDVVVTAMDGASVSPPVATTASGVAATTVDAQASVATVHVNTTGVDDATDAHVHEAAAGANNTTVLIALEKDAAAPAHWFAELQEITAANQGVFNDNGWYVDVHTPANADGALRGQITPNPEPAPPPPGAATLTQLQSTIFTPICSSCHNGSGASLPGSMNLSSAAASFAALVSVASDEQPSVLRVAPNSPDDSYLVRKLEGAPGIGGARMPLGGPFLDQATIDQVRSWISAGAPNN